MSCYKAQAHLLAELAKCRARGEETEKKLNLFRSALEAPILRKSDWIS